jgi:hypothetical protein
MTADARPARPLSARRPQLNFPVVFFLLCLVPLGIFLLVRYKYLNKYEELKETPCVLPRGHARG